MPFLVRKIMRSSNESHLLGCEKHELSNIIADVTTNEFRTSDGKLSVWLINSLEDLKEAALAICMGGQRIEDLKLMVIDLAEIEAYFSLDKSPGNTAIASLVDMHRDICGISHASLTVLLEAYKDAVDSDRCVRYKTKDLKGIIKEALENHRINIDDVAETNERLAEELRKLQAS